MKLNHHKTPSVLPPFHAREIHASVVLVAPLTDGFEVHERITQETVADMQRYILLADQLLAGKKSGEKTVSEAASKAA